MRVRGGYLLLALALGGCTRALTNYSGQPGPRYAGDPTEPPAEPDRGDLKVVSWNVQWGEDPGAAARVLESHPALSQADIVLLQEMNERSVERIAGELGMGYVYYPATLHPRTGRHFGNAILSHWPILEDRKLELPGLARFVGTGRAAVVATVVVRGQRLRVYSIHLATAISRDYRTVERQMVAVMEDARTSPDPVIIGGDFNSTRVGGLLLRDGFHWLTRRVGPTAWIHSFDHLFVRGLPGAQVAAGTANDDDLPSDHLPVWTRIGLGSGAVSPP
jgi:endonuclease/exonuclease/phosphatase family metal-dependent hydrolase